MKGKKINRKEEIGREKKRWLASWRVMEQLFGSAIAILFIFLSCYIIYVADSSPPKAVSKPVASFRPTGYAQATTHSGPRSVTSFRSPVRSSNASFRSPVRSVQSRTPSSPSRARDETSSVVYVLRLADGCFVRVVAVRLFFFCFFFVFES